MSQSYTAVQKLLASGYKPENVAAVITVFKNEALREFCLNNLNLFQAEDFEGQLVAKVNEEFGFQGFSLAAEGDKDEYIGDLYDEDLDDLSPGERYVAYDTLSAFGHASQNPYEHEWLECVDRDEVEGCVREISQVDRDWGVFITPEMTAWTNREYVEYVHNYADEKLSHEECSLDEVKMFDGFGTELPHIVAGKGVTYSKPEFELGDPKDGYCYVEKTKQLNEARRSGYTRFATRKRGRKLLDAQYTRCVCIGEFALYDDINLPEDSDSESDDDEGTVTKIHICEEVRSTGLPNSLAAVYQTLKAPPGRAYYLHVKRRSKTLERLRKIGYLSQGVAKKQPSVVAKRTQVAQAPSPSCSGNVQSGEGWIKQYVDLARRKVGKETLLSIFGKESVALAKTGSGGNGKNALRKRIGRDLDDGPVRFDTLLYCYVDGFASEFNCTEIEARQAIFLVMGGSFGSYDFYEKDCHWMIKKHVV